MAKAIKGPPKITLTKRVKEEGAFAAMGIELSKELPTYSVPMDLISLNEWNSNEMSDAMFNRLVKEMEETGMVAAIQIAPSEGRRFRVVGGEHRFRGAQALGWEKIPCHILMDGKFADEDLQKLLSVRLNVIHGKMNPEKFKRLYEDVAKRYGKEQLQALFGFTESDAWQKLTKGVVDSVAASGIGGSALSAELRKRTKTVRTVDGLGNLLNKLFKKYGSDVEHGFMVFSYGGKEHIFIIASERMAAAIESVKDVCRNRDTDINDILAKVFEEIPGRIGELTKQCH